VTDIQWRFESHCVCITVYPAWLTLIPVITPLLPQPDWQMLNCLLSLCVTDVGSNQHGHVDDRSTCHSFQQTVLTDSTLGKGSTADIEQNKQLGNHWQTLYQLQTFVVSVHNSYWLLLRGGIVQRVPCNCDHLLSIVFPIWVIITRCLCSGCSRNTL
jgi:hypothetical protein